MRILKYFINLVLIFILVIFFIENSQQLSQRVQFHFDLFIPGLLWQMPELPIYFLIIIFFVLGGLITACIFTLGRISISYKLAQANKKIRGLEKEVTAYRKLPLETGDFLKEDSDKANAPSQGV